MRVDVLDRTTVSRARGRRIRGEAMAVQMTIGKGLWACLLYAAACSGTDISAAADGPDASIAPDAGSDASVDAADAEAATLDALARAACTNSSPFDDERCGAALATWCRALSTERDCMSAAKLDLDREYVCKWAKATTYSDVATCAVEHVEGQCGAYFVLDAGCSCTAFVANHVLIESPRPCPSADGSLWGPIDRSWSLEVQRNEPGAFNVCGPNLVPQAPEICGCSARCGR